MYILCKTFDGNFSFELFSVSVLPLGGRGALRPVCGHTSHLIAMIHTFLESLSDLDVHPGICFSIFYQLSPELASNSALYVYIVLTKDSIAIRFRAGCCRYSHNLHIFGKPNWPTCRWTSTKIVKIDVAKAMTPNTFWFIYSSAATSY